MTTRYVGIGGNDGNTGLSWAQRKLTLNGVEDTPVVAGDVCYIGPGVYRELLTVDVNGSAGNIITYVADRFGENTDGVGGVVRITGSDNDQAAARANCITATDKDYRTFRGFQLDLTTSNGVFLDGCEDITIEDCVPTDLEGTAIRSVGVGQLRVTVRRCLFAHTGLALVSGIGFEAGVNDGSHIIENCIFVTDEDTRAIDINDQGGVDIKNCTWIGSNRCINVDLAGLGAPVACTVTNSILVHATTGILATNLGEITEDFNAFYANSGDRINVNVGGNSNTFPMLAVMPILHAGAGQVSGYQFPWGAFGLSEWSQLRAITDDGAGPSEDLYGVPRPVTNGKRSWGAIQFVDSERETGTVRTGVSALVLHDAGRHQIIVPMDGAQTTIAIWVRRETNYAGNLPQMIIKQPGVADRVTASVAAVNTWEELTDTFTPAALPGYVVVELVSRNTAAALAYETFFDDMSIDGGTVDIGTFDNWITDRMFYEDNPGAPGGAFYTLSRGTMRGVV